MMTIVAFISFISIALSLCPLNIGNGDLIPNKYIVVFKNTSKIDHASEIVNAKSLFGSRVKYVYANVLKGYSVELSQDELQVVRSNPSVDYVEADQVMRASQSGCSSQTKIGRGGLPWGLERICEKKPILNGRYKYPDQAGAGITVFVLDTGIYWQNIDFAGRASFGWKAENQWSNLDAHGHGTHCASTAVGELYGVAKKANAVAVKVLGDNGSGSTAGVIAGVDWVPSQTNRGVASMSLGGGFSSALNAAVTQAVSQGVVVVVAAGNSNADACLYSPSSAPAATTVGSTTIGEKINGDSSDDRSSFSNFGTCVDIFAPGSLITAAWIGATDAFNTISGTSMACPHVSGAAALLLGAGNSPQQVKLLLQGDSSKDEIDFKCGGRQNCDRSPNYLLFNGCL